jgi:tetratricopeptide (TPR) repeat protein
MGASAESSTNHFVGRERELAELHAALDDANAGRGRLFVLSGEPGIGKTRLAEEVAREAATRGMRAVWGRSWEGGGAPAYWPWVQILRSLLLDPNRPRIRGPVVAPEVGQLVPELASEVVGQPKSDPKQALFRLFDAVTTALKDAARAQTLVLILDDLHEADSSSLEMLKFIVRALPESHLLIIGTCRDAEVRRSPMLSEAIAEILRAGRQMPLGGLLPGEVGRMVMARSDQASSAGFIGDLHQVTAGNPLFVEGVLSVLSAEGKLGSLDRLDLEGFRLPEGVRGSIRKRLELLSGPALELLIVAAAIGQEFDLAVLQRVSLGSAEVRSMLREAVEIGVVAIDCEPPRFSHPLIREALHRDAGEDELIRMHNRIGEVLEEIHAADLASHSAQLAYHYELGGNLEKAIDYSNRAARAAAKVYAYQQGRNFSETALRLMEKRGALAGERARQLLRTAALAAAFDIRAAIDHLEKAVALFEDAGDLEGSAEAHVRIGTCLIPWDVQTASTYTMNTDRAFGHFAAAQKTLRDRPASATIVRLYCGIAQASWEAARMQESLDAARRALEIAEQVGREDVWQDAAGKLTFALTASGRVSESFPIIERLRERAQLSGDPAILQAAAHSTAFHFLFSGDLASAAQWFQRLLSMPVVSEAMRRSYSLFMTFPLAWTGKLKEARAISTRYFLGRLWESTIAFCEGDWEQILAPGYGRPNKPSGSIWSGVLDPSCLQGHQLRIVGCHERAEPLLRSVIEVCGGLVLFEFRARTNLALIYLELQLKDKAAVEIERCREIIAAAGDWRSCVGDLHRAEGVLASFSENIPEAESHFANAIQIYRRYSLPFEEADTLHYWGRALNAHGDAVRATEKFDAAIEIYHQVGAGQRWIERIEKAAPNKRRDNAISSSAEHNQFRRDGAQWNIIYQGEAVRMKDSRGIRYLAHLLRYPHQEFHVLDLASWTNVGERPAGDVAVVDYTALEKVLDPKARAQYARRLDDLREEYRDAQRCNDLGRSAKTQQEIEQINSVLSASLGLGGRPREFASNAERARVAVSKRIKAAIGQIRDLNAELGRHLGAAVATGNFCSYRPDPQHPIDWQF